MRWDAESDRRLMIDSVFVFLALGAFEDDDEVKRRLSRSSSPWRAAAAEEEAAHKARLGDDMVKKKGEK